MKNSKIFIIPTLCFILYLLFIIPGIDDPLTSDELTWPASAESLIKTGNAVDVLGGSAHWSPPLYLNIQAILYRVFGISNISSRLIGIFCILLHLILICYFGKFLFANHSDRWRFVLLTSLIFITNPAVIQGSLITDIDTTLLPVFLTLFALIFIKNDGIFNLPNIAVLSIIFSMCLWSKLTTPPLLMFSMFAYYFINRDREGVFHTVAMAVLAIFLFLASWATYARLNNLDVMGPIDYAIGAFVSKQVIKESTLFGILTTIVRFILWFGVYSFILGAVTLIKRALNFKDKKLLKPIDLLAIYFILVGVGYIVIGGTPFGFPKYHYPIFPAIAIISAFMFKDLWNKVSVKDLVLYFCVTVLAFFCFYFFIEDPIHLFNFSTRQMIVNNFGTKSIILLLLHKLTLYLFLGLVIFAMIRTYAKKYTATEHILVTLVILILAANLSLNFIQSRAPYLKRYCYGEEGTKDLIKYLQRGLLPGDAVLVTCDIVYYLREGGKEIPYFSDDSWYKLDKIKKIIEDPSVKFVVYSIGHNDITQFKEVILNPVFASELERNFVLRQIGTYKVWKRKF